MKTPSPDTAPAAHAVQLELLRQLTPAQRLAIVKRLRAAADTMALARLRRDYPDDDARTRRLRLAALKYDRSLMIAAFDWDPEREGR